MPRALVCVGTVAVLLVLNAFLYSPWHQHNRSSGQACSFSSFEHAAGLEAAPVNPLPPPALLGEWEASPDFAGFPGVSLTTPAERSPPA